MNAKLFPVPPCPCPHCGKVLDRALHASGEPPRGPAPGDLTICNGCLQVCRFVQDGSKLKLEASGDGDLECPIRAWLVVLRAKFARQS